MSTLWKGYREQPHKIAEVPDLIQEQNIYYNLQRSVHPTKQQLRQLEIAEYNSYLLKPLLVFNTTAQLLLIQLRISYL